MGGAGQALSLQNNPAGGGFLPPAPGPTLGLPLPRVPPTLGRALGTLLVVLSTCTELTRGLLTASGGGT